MISAKDPPARPPVPSPEPAEGLARALRGLGRHLAQVEVDPRLAARVETSIRAEGATLPVGAAARVLARPPER